MANSSRYYQTMFYGDFRIGSNLKENAFHIQYIYTLLILHIHSFKGNLICLPISLFSLWSLAVNLERALCALN